MKKHLHSQPKPTLIKQNAPQNQSHKSQNQHIQTQDLIQKRDFAPENVIAAQSIIGNQAIMRLVGEQVMLRWGSRGDDVVTLQQILNQRNKAGLTEDGIFGPLTYKAVTAFQQQEGLSVDGIVGPQTWDKLNHGGKDTPPQPTPPENEDNTGQQLVASMQTIKTLMGGFALASEGDMTSFDADPLNLVGDDPAIAAVKPFIGDALKKQQDTDNTTQSNNFVPLQQGTTTQKSVAPPEVAIPELFKEINKMIPNLPAQLQAGFNVTLAQMKAVVDQIKQGKNPTPAMVTTFNTATANLLKVANKIQVPATPDGSSTKFDIQQPTKWKITADDIGGVGQELETHASTHGEAAHVKMTPDMSNAVKPNKTTTQVEVVIKLEPEFPEWTKAAQVGQKCPCWKQEWDKFSTAIEAHEQQHIAIYKLFLSNLHIRCQGKTQSEADTIFDDTVEAAENAQKQFDDATQHGIIGVPSTAFNAGRSCKGC